MVGCAGSFPSPTHRRPAILVEADDDQDRTWRLVLDLGSGAVGPLQRYARLDGLDAVLLSHLHPDHVADVCGLYVARQYAPDGPPPFPLPLYGPRGTADRIRLAYGGDPAGLDTTFEVREFADARPVDLGPLTVTPYRVAHPVEAYGLRVEHHAGRRVAVSPTPATPTAATSTAAAGQGRRPPARGGVVPRGQGRARGVHLTGLRAGRAAARRRVPAARAHAPSGLGRRGVVLAEARSAFPGPVDRARSGGAVPRLISWRA